MRRPVLHMPRAAGDSEKGMMSAAGNPDFHMYILCGCSYDVAVARISCYLSRSSSDLCSQCYQALARISFSLSLIAVTCNCAHGTTHRASPVRA